MGATAAHRVLHGTSEGIRVVGKNVSRKGSAQSSGRTRSIDLGIEAFFDRQRESSERLENAGVAEGGEGVGTEAQRRGSKKTPESMRVVEGASGRRTERREESLNGGAGMEARQGGKSNVPRMVAAEKSNRVKEEMEKDEAKSLQLDDELAADAEEAEAGQRKAKRKGRSV